MSKTQRVGMSFLGAAGLIAVVTVVSRLFGFGRWLVQAHALGPTLVGSVYNTANTVPNIVFEIAAGGALAGVVVPILAKPIATRMREDINRISSAMTSWVLLILVPIALVVVILAEPIISLLLWGSGTSDAIALGTTLLRMFALQIPLYGLSIVFTGILQAQKKFFWPAFAPMLSSIVVIISYFVFASITQGQLDQTLSQSAVAWLGWGTTAGVAAMSLPLLIPIYRSGVRLTPTLHFPEGVAPRVRSLALAGVGVLLAQQLATIAIILIANNYGGAGALPVFNYAQAVYFLPYAILTVPIATSSFPRLARYAALNTTESFATMTSVVTRVVIAVSMVGISILIATAPAIQEIFAQLSQSSDGSVEGMTSILTWTAPGLVGYSLIFSATRVLYSKEHGKAAVLCTSIGWLTTALVAWVAAVVLSGHGSQRESTLTALGLGNSVGMIVAGIALILAINSIVGRRSSDGIVRTITVCAIATAVLAVIGRLIVNAMLSSSLLVTLFAALIAALLCFLGMAIVMWVCDRSTLSEVLRMNQDEVSA